MLFFIWFGVFFLSDFVFVFPDFFVVILIERKNMKLGGSGGRSILEDLGEGNEYDQNNV